MKSISLPFERENVFRADQARERNTVGRRIAAARARAGYTQAELAERLRGCGVSVQPPAVNKWEKGETLPGVYTLAALTKVLAVGDMMLFFDDRGTPPAESLNADGQMMLRRYREYLESDPRYARPLRETPMIWIPVSTLPASAGWGDFLEEEHFEKTAFPARVVPWGTDFAVRVHGDSMEPAYHDGQIVFVERAETLRDGDTGLFSLEDEGYIKIYREELPAAEEAEEFTDSDGALHPRVRLVSLNPAYPPIEVQGGLRIFGRILC